MPNIRAILRELFPVGSETSGFQSLHLEEIADLDITAASFSHPQSGAHLLHLATNDPEKLFAIALRTPPPDDTGLPHIIEHSVLCGSRRFPVKDPFVELLKTSMATFLNAFTYPDRTIYPCASLNHADFHNLVQVYCDAVFFPLLREDHFRQEGHHLEITPAGKLILKGVVYNEMRGVYSDPDGILERHIQRLLFAGNAYGNDFGGDPEAISSLTYADYLAFHQRYYHPANAWFFSYGDLDLVRLLQFLDREYLSSFKPISVDSVIQPLPPRLSPESFTFTYPLDQVDSVERKTDIALAMTANDSRDLLETLAMKVVSGYLLDNSASPLRKALIDSKLGDDLGSSGYADWQRDTYFCLVLKGSEPGNAAAMEELCLSVLSQECERGFDREKVNSVLRQIELLARERRPQYPLRLMERVFSGWLYDSDPIQQLRLSERLEELRNNIDHQPGYLEAITRRYLLENPHRLRVTLVPDLELAASREKADQEAMASRLERLAPEEIQAIRDTASRLETMQSEGNTPEALATLPRLCLTDVSPHPLELAYEQERAGNFDLLDVKVASGGVAYLHLSLDLEGLPDDIIDYLPLFSEALGKGGAGGLDYAAMAEREAAATGALDFSAGMAGHINGPDKARLRFSIWMKALESEWAAALAVLGDRLFRPDFQDQERLRDIILQDRMGWRNQIVPSGNAYAALFAGRLLSRPLAISERLGGCSQARRIDHLADTVETALSELPDRFTTIQQEILARAVPSASLVGSPAVKAATRAWLADNSRLFSLSSPAALSPPVVAAPVPRRVALAAPTDVNYAARVLPAPPLDSPDAPALILLGLQWSYGYLWNEIRVKGGAYGARAAYDGVNGVFQFSSYRDPAINRTLAAFAGLEKFAAEVMDLSPAGLEQAIIGTVKTLDQPIRPSAAATLALSRHLGGESAAFRQKFRDRLLGLGADEVRQAAARVFTGLAEAPICVIGSRERINQENLAGDSFHLHLESLWEADPSLDKAASTLDPDID